jgi:single-strand DNA-binding protein
MASFNQVILLGNLTRDPQLKYLPNQTPVAEFGLACNRKFKGANGEEREDVLFVDCAAFGKTGEVIHQYFTKGKPIFVQGRLKYDSWEDKNGGGKRSKLSVVIDNFQFIGGRDGGGAGGGGGHEGGGGEYEQRPQRSAPPQRAPQGRPQNAPPPQQPFGEEEQFKDDDIPF